MKDHKLEIDSSQYTLALKIKNGHRYFWFKGPEYDGGFGGDRLAIADNSGKFPHLTDDGLLFVNNSRIGTSPDTISISPQGASIPLIDIHGNTCCASGSVFEAFGVAWLLGLNVEILDPGKDPENKIEICGTQIYWNNRNRQPSDKENH